MNITTTDIILGLAFLTVSLVLDRKWPWLALRWVALAFWHVGTGILLFPGRLLLRPRDVTPDPQRSGYADRAEGSEVAAPDLKKLSVSIKASAGGLTAALGQVGKGAARAGETICKAFADVDSKQLELAEAIKVGEVWHNDDTGNTFTITEAPRGAHQRIRVQCSAHYSDSFTKQYILQHWTKIREADGSEVKDSASTILHRQSVEDEGKATPGTLRGMVNTVRIYGITFGEAEIWTGGAAGGSRWMIQFLAGGDGPSQYLVGQQVEFNPSKAEWLGEHDGTSVTY